MTRDEQLIRAALEMAAEASIPAPQGPEPTEFAAGCRHALLSANARIRAIDPADVLAKVGAEIDRRDHLANGPARIWMHEGSSAPWFVKPAGNSTEYVRADLSPAPDAVARLVEAARALVSIVEGIDGAMNHGTWRDERGVRLKDTPEWVGLYNALAAMEADRD